METVFFFSFSASYGAAVAWALTFDWNIFIVSYTNYFGNSSADLSSFPLISSNYFISRKEKLKLIPIHDSYQSFDDITILVVSSVLQYSKWIEHYSWKS